MQLLFNLNLEVVSNALSPEAVFDVVGSVHKNVLDG